MKIPYWIKQLRWMKVFFSPFKRPKIRLYLGKIAYGTPYFYPRKWVKFTRNDAIKKAVEDTQNRSLVKYGLNPLDLIDSYMGYSKPVPKKIGFDFVSLGWKTKWTDIDYRFEWGPMWSFVFFKWQFCVFFVVPVKDHYWTSWLYYTNNTHGTSEERVKQCREGFPNIWKRWEGEKEILIDYYPIILKKKYGKST